EELHRRHRRGESRPGGVDEQPRNGQDGELPEGEAEQDGVLAFDICGYPSTHRRLGVAARHQCSPFCWALSCRERRDWDDAPDWAAVSAPSADATPPRTSPPVPVPGRRCVRAWPECGRG